MNSLLAKASLLRYHKIDINGVKHIYKARLPIFYLIISSSPIRGLEVFKIKHSSSVMIKPYSVLTAPSSSHTSLDRFSMTRVETSQNHSSGCHSFFLS